MVVVVATKVVFSEESLYQFASPARSKDLSVPIRMTFLEVMVNMVNFLPSNPGNFRSMPRKIGEISCALQAAPAASLE